MNAAVTLAGTSGYTWLIGLGYPGTAFPRSDAHTWLPFGRGETRLKVRCLLFLELYINHYETIGAMALR